MTRAIHPAWLQRSADGRLAMFLTRDGLVGLDPATGAVQFQRRWRARIAASVNAATPHRRRRLDLRVGRVRARRRRPARRMARKLIDVWTSDEVLSNHYATSVYHDGYLYGFHGRQEFGPSLRAVELRTGTVKWSQDQFRAGSVTAGGRRAADHPRRRRDDSGAGVAAGVQAARARADPAGRRPAVARASPTASSTSATRTRSSVWICAK